MIERSTRFTCRFCARTEVVYYPEGATLPPLKIDQRTGLPGGWSWIRGLLCCEKHSIHVLPEEHRNLEAVP
jgi:hypothetical protein